MPKDYFDFHPFRFQLLTAALDLRQELDRTSDNVVGQIVSTAASHDRTAEFAGMSGSELYGRLDLMARMRNAWSRWSAAGSEILDFSEEMASMAGSKIVELPWASPLNHLSSVYVHFGAEAELSFAGRDRVIEGAYLESAADPRIVLAHFVCNEVPSGGTLADGLVAQSEVVATRLDRRTDEFVDFGGDISLVSASPKSALLSRTLYAVAHILGPSPDLVRSSTRVGRPLLN